MAPHQNSRGSARVDVGLAPEAACTKCGRRLVPGARHCPYDGEPAAPPPEGDSLVGQLIDDRYLVKSVLGHGGMGIVYAVQHTKLGRPLALKVLRRDLARDADLCKRFIQEARAAAAINHPGVVQITDFGVLSSGQPYFVMELLSGRSLSRLMAQERPLPLDRMINIIEQLVDALEAAHAVNVIHRDLKPDNIHVSPDSTRKDVVKVLDFGLARVAGATRLTKQGFVFGTPHYMSPEQAQGDPVDHRADIYALGVLMYEMATGQVPFDAESYMGVLTKHISMGVVAPSKILGHRRLGALELILLRCLEKRPQKRYQSLRELSDDLRLVVKRTDAGIQIAPRSRLSVRRWSPERLLRALRRQSRFNTRFSANARFSGGGPIAAPLALGAAVGVALALVGLLVVPAWRGTPAEGTVSTAPRSPGAEAKPRDELALAPPVAAAKGEPGPEPRTTASPALPRQRVSIESAHAEAAADDVAKPLGTVRPRRAAAARRTSPAPLPTTDIVDPWADSTSQ